MTVFKMAMKTADGGATDVRPGDRVFSEMHGRELTVSRLHSPCWVELSDPTTGRRLPDEANAASCVAVAR